MAAPRGTRKTTLAKRRRGKLAVMIPWLRRFGLGLALIVAILWVGAWVWMSGLMEKAGSAAHEELIEASAGIGFRVQNILVENRHRTDPVLLKELINVQKGDPLFAFDPVTAKSQIEKINWVKSAHVERRLPATVYIHIEERVPVALWQNAGKLQLIDDKGEIITRKNLEQFPRLMIVLGENAPSHVEGLVRELAQHDELQARIASAKWVGDRRWDLKLHDKAIVKLPEIDMKQAFDALARMQKEDAILDKDISEIDLREPGRVTVGPASGKIVNYKDGARAKVEEGNNI